jgi:XTP/dITP diphosphohydrolase
VSRPLLLATTNPAKLARLRWLLDGTPFALRAPADLALASPPTVPEDGADFAANAAQKALAWSAAAGGMATLASDGGMAIPALGSRWDALRTRRQAGPGASDRDRIDHLLRLMRGLHGEDRRAVWHEALALAADGVLLHTWTAQGDGGLIVEAAPPDSSDDGFWTEQVRWYPAIGKRSCECTEGEREQVNDVWPRLRPRVRADFSRLL